MKKVMTILGTRPEIIRLSAVIKACDTYFNHILVHTGQNWDYTLNDIFFKQLHVRKPDRFLEVAGEHLGQTMGNIISRSYEVLVEEKPDALLILGDTNSALSAIPAKRLKIPIFHMEAGNRCFDQNVPEEINRKIVDHISDINLAYTEHSRKYLLAEGLRRDHVFVTGSPMPEVLGNHMSEITESTILGDLGLEKDGYILISAHREENIDIDKNFDNLVDTLNKVAETYGKKMIFSTHPRSRKKLEEKNITFNENIINLEPFGFLEYNKLQKNAYCVLSDSGTLSEESAILKFPAVLIRTSTERPEVLDRGSIVIGGISPEDVIDAIKISRGIYEAGARPPVPLDYIDVNVSLKVVKIIESYIKVINRVTWYK